MDPVVGIVTAQPLDALQVRRQLFCTQGGDVEAQHVGGVEQRFFLGGDKEFLGGPFQAFFDADLLGQVIGVIVGIGQTRFRRAFVAEVRVFVEVLLHQRAIVQVFEPPAAIGHGGFQNFRTHGQQNVAGRHAAELAFGVKVRRGGWQRMVDAGWAIHPDAASFQHAGEAVEQFVRPVDRVLRTAAPLAAHVAVFGDLGVQRRLFRRDVAVIGAPDDDVAKGVPFVPAVHNGFLHGVHPSWP